MIGPLDISATVVLAHAGHWYFLPLYLAPVGFVLYVAIKVWWEERREGRDEENSAADPPT